MNDCFLFYSEKFNAAGWSDEIKQVAMDIGEGDRNFAIRKMAEPQMKLE